MPMPLPPDYLSGNWNQMFDEPFYRPRPLNFDGFSKLFLKNIEDTAVRDIPEAGIAMLCAISELTPPIRVPMYDSKGRRYSCVEPILENHSGGPKWFVPTTGDEFIDLLAWVFEKWTFGLTVMKLKTVS